MNYQPMPLNRCLPATPESLTATAATAHPAAGTNLRLLRDCLRRARQWENDLPANGGERETAIELKILAESLIEAGNPSIIAMCKVRKLLCSVCRRLHATHELCDGRVLQPLEECLVLKEQDS